MSEKLASAEIDESRRYLESIRVKTYACRCASCIANLEEAVERDTRERIAQLAIDAIKETMRDHFPSRMFTSEIELVCVRVAERIRGVNR